MVEFARSCRDQRKSGGRVALLALMVMFSLSGAEVARAQSDADASALRTLAGTPGNQEAIRHLRDQGIAPDVPGSDGRTALHEAVLSGDLRNLQALLKGAGDPNLDVQDADGDSPLHLLVVAAGDMSETEAFAFAEFLLEAGANPCVDNERRCNVWEDAVDAAPVRRALELSGMDDATCRGDPEGTP